MKLIPGSAQAIRLLNVAGYCVVIITNQPHIAKGMLTVKQVEETNKLLVDTLEKQGAKIEAVYYCPHHPEKGHAGTAEYI